MRQVIARLETREGSFEVPARIGELGPAAERHAVLVLFQHPLVHFLDEIRIIGEDTTQIDAVVVAVALDHGGSLDVAHNLGIDLRRVEAIPVDRLESPVAHRSNYPSQPSPKRNKATPAAGGNGGRWGNATDSFA